MGTVLGLAVNEETKSPSISSLNDRIMESSSVKHYNNFPQNQKVVVAEEARNKSQQFILNCLPHRSK